MAEMRLTGILSGAAEFGAVALFVTMILIWAHALPVI